MLECWPTLALQNISVSPIYYFFHLLPTWHQEADQNSLEIIMLFDYCALNRPLPSSSVRLLESTNVITDFSIMVLRRPSGNWKLGS